MKPEVFVEKLRAIVKMELELADELLRDDRPKDLLGFLFQTAAYNQNANLRKMLDKMTPEKVVLTYVENAKMFGAYAVMEILKKEEGGKKDKIPKIDGDEQCQSADKNAKYTPGSAGITDPSGTGTGGSRRSSEKEKPSEFPTCPICGAIMMSEEDEICLSCKIALEK